MSPQNIKSIPNAYHQTIIGAILPNAQYKPEKDFIYGLSYFDPTFPLR